LGQAELASIVGRDLKLAALNFNRNWTGWTSLSAFYANLGQILPDELTFFSIGISNATPGAFDRGEASTMMRLREQEIAEI